MLREATEQEKRERDALTHAEWAGGLTVPQFCEREMRLRAHPWSAGAMTTWVWTCEAGSILSSCETFRMRSAAAGRFGHAYAVASVFTEPRLRGRGYAAKMMAALVERLREIDRWAHASILFSDVGPKLYARAGYAPRAAVDRIWLSEEGDPHEGVEPLSERDVPEAMRAIRPPCGAFQVLATAPQIDWHLERERIYSELLHRPRPPLCGARAGASTALWAAVFKQNELHVLLFDARTPGEANRLVRSATRAAHRVNTHTA